MFVKTSHENTLMFVKLITTNLEAVLKIYFTKFKVGQMNTYVIT
jgi:hypothetical protein